MECGPTLTDPIGCHDSLSTRAARLKTHFSLTRADSSLRAAKRSGAISAPERHARTRTLILLRLETVLRGAKHLQNAEFSGSLRGKSGPTLARYA